MTVIRPDSVEQVATTVTPPQAYAQNEQLFRAMEALFPVTFRAQPESDAQDRGPALLLGCSRADALAMAGKGRRCLAFLGGDAAIGNGRTRRVVFGNMDAVPRHFRRRTLVERSPTDFCCTPLEPDLGDVVIATIDERPLWVHRPAREGRGALDMVAVSPFLTDSSSLLAEEFSRERFMGLLPLLHFLQQICAARNWTSPPLRACFVFDDLNLRRKSYGCLDYRSLAAHARQHRYHAAIATIPLDAGRTSPDTAALFRDYPGQLSLAIHGNDHLSLELARECPESERIAVLAQARRRMAALEQRYCLSVCAVEEPPFGVIRADYFPALAALEYEATLLTLRQFRQCNSPASLPPAFGLAAAEYLPGGLAMIPRITAAPGWETEATLAAFLGQPVVIAGHHFDASGGLRFLECIAEYVNGLGPVVWSSLSTIARSSFLQRRDGRTLSVRAASRRIEVAVPTEVEEILLQRPWVTDDDMEELAWGKPGQAALGRVASGGRSTRIPTMGEALLEIVSPVQGPVDPMLVAPPPPRAWPVVRRAFTEARDRYYPFLPGSLRRRLATMSS